MLRANFPYRIKARRLSALKRLAAQTSGKTTLEQRNAHILLLHQRTGV